LQWVVIDPLKPETYDQADEMLQLPKCVGIKIHPEEHGYPIAEHGEPIFRFAAERRAIILTHSGEQRSMPEDCVPFANDFPEARLVLAHLGCGWDSDPSHQVRAIQSSQHNNVFVDTSSASSIMSGLIEWAVKEIGAERILYGTDTPLYCASMQRTRIDNAAISDEAKRLILRDNAMNLFEFPQDAKV
jgi:predicted TIM-barrel fold metal-dependent hydrolase